MMVYWLPAIGIFIAAITDVFYCRPRRKELANYNAAMIVAAICYVGMIILGV